ncbi:MAG TPA: alpha/beta hydrolase [Bacteroidales bacterium]|nr:alpha/beta hydrolase [Bacteroidales bacterium]
MFITIQGRKIWYTESGSGTPVILLHGYLESSEIWNSFVKTFPGDFRVIAIDLPGHGKSDVFSETQTMEMMAGVVKELSDMLKLGKSFLVGHSLGGYVTLAFLELFTESLSGYCLFHSHPLADSDEAMTKRKKEIELVLAGKKDLIYPDNIEKMFASSNLERLIDKVRVSKQIASGIPGNGIIAVLNGMMKRPSRIEIMEEGRVPCLWILGKLDSYIKPVVMQEKVKLPENARLVLLNKSGHMGFIEEEALSAETLVRFIKEIS